MCGLCIKGKTCFPFSLFVPHHPPSDPIPLCLQKKIKRVPVFPPFIGEVVVVNQLNVVAGEVVMVDADGHCCCW